MPRITISDKADRNLECLVVGFKKSLIFLKKLRPF